MSDKKLMYGDKITIKFSPLVEQEIAQILEDWIVNLSSQKEIDLLHEEFQTMREIVRKLAELGEIYQNPND